MTGSGGPWSSEPSSNRSSVPGEVFRSLEEPGEYDTEFHRLNALIDEAATANPGFLGSESW
jgi:hypothetical protein